MTQSEFAAAIGVSYTTMNRWENGKSLPNLKAMKAIDDFCKANNISYDVRELNTVNKWYFANYA